VSNEHQHPKEQQLSEFIRTLPAAVIVTGGAVFSVSLLFVPLLNSFGILAMLASVVGETSYLPYQFTAWVMLTLYLIPESFKSGDDNESHDDAPGDETRLPPINELNREIILKRLRDSANEIFEAIAKMAHIWLLISVAAVTSAYATNHGLPYFGILIAVLLPIVETKLSSTEFWVLSPSTVLTFPMFLILIPVTIFTVMVAALGGLIISLSQTLQVIVSWGLKRLIRVFNTVNISTPVFEAFEKSFIQSQRR